MTQSRDAIDKRLDLIWEKHKHNAQTSDVGTYVDIDNLSIKDTGLSHSDMQSPGNFNTWKSNTSSGRYFLEGFGAGRTRMFRR